MIMKCKLAIRISNPLGKHVNLKAGETIVIEKLYDSEKIGYKNYEDATRAMIPEYSPSYASCVYENESIFISLGVLMLGFSQVEETTNE